MTEVIREGDRTIVTSASLTCPALRLCDRFDGEKYSHYVRRHCDDHQMGKEFAKLEDAERNLGVHCFYYNHKYIFGNATLLPQPFYGMHAFIAEDSWNEDDLEERVPISKKTFARIPDAADRRPGDVRLMKQCEVPRQCEKTSTGSIAYPIFESLRQYYVFDERNYPFMIRSETALRARMSLAIIRAKGLRGKNIKRLYGVKLLKCPKCGAHSHVPDAAADRCPGCGETKRLRAQPIALIDPTRGAGGTGADSVTFRWATNTADVGQVVKAAELTLASITGDEGDESDEGGAADDEDFEPEAENEEAVYSIRAAGLKTALTGQRPRVYVLDDIQTQDNSDTHDKRLKIQSRFDEAKRQVKFGGRMLVFDTRKYISDFAGKITEEPLRSLFHTMHARARWPTDEPNDPPYVVNGMRYFFPVDGNGAPALDKATLDDYESQMLERDYSAEFNNDPADPTRATFKREHFITIRHEDAPPEIRFGLGRDVSPTEQAELDSLGLRIIAYNACDPAGIAEQKKRGDDCFIVCVRFDRYGRWHITKMSAGKWSSRRRWDEIDRANGYNRPQLTDYELPASEIDTKDSFEKWIRDRREELSALGDDAPSLVVPPMKFRSMPKSAKRSREDQMELFMPIYILDDACDKELREKFINQFVGLGVEDHDDGPDATSRLITYVTRGRYKKPEEAEKAQQITVVNGAAHVPLSVIMGAAKPPKDGGLWGQQGGSPPCGECGRSHPGRCPVKEKTRVA